MDDAQIKPFKRETPLRLGDAITMHSYRPKTNMLSANLSTYPRGAAVTGKEASFSAKSIPAFTAERQLWLFYVGL